MKLSLISHTTEKEAHWGVIMGRPRVMGFTRTLSVEGYPDREFLGWLDRIYQLPECLAELVPDHWLSEGFDVVNSQVESNINENVKAIVKIEFRNHQIHESDNIESLTYEPKRYWTAEDEDEDEDEDEIDWGSISDRTYTEVMSEIEADESDDEE